MLYLQVIDYGFNFGLIISSIWGALICLIGYQIFIHPKVVFFDEAIEIVNPFTRHLIGWQDVDQIDTRYTMSIKTHGEGVATKQIYAFADPAPGRYHSRSIHQSELRGLNIQSTGSIQAGQSPNSHSGVASAIANQKVIAFQRLDKPQLVQYRYKFNRKALLIHLILFVTGTLLLIIHN
ncbi:MAG: PH domain-containing protein, partial [Candidatus Nanopelagicus sp.]